MRVLFVTSRVPGILPRGDQRRAFYQIRYLSARHRITLLALDCTPPHHDGYADLERCCERMRLVRRGRLGSAWQVLRALNTNLPLQVAVNDGKELRKELSRLLRDDAFDLVHVQMARLGTFATAVQPLPCVVDLVDALSRNMARRATYDGGPMSWVARLEAGRMAAYERDLCSRVAAATVSAAQDRDSIGALPNLHVVPNGVDLGSFPFVEGGARGCELAFIGNLGYFPNVDAIKWFASEVLPRLAATHPSVRLNLIGARPAADVRWLAARHRQIRLIGPVRNVQPYLVQAAVAVVPLRAGSGQQLKILEAMAAGTPVVATTTAASGVDAVKGVDLLVGGDAAEIAIEIGRILDQPALGVSLARNARALIERRYSWQHSTLEMERVWLTAVGEHR